MEPSIRVEPAKPEDMPRCVELMNQAFGFVPILRLAHGEDSPENRLQMAAAHLTAQRQHMERFPSVPVCIKCVLPAGSCSPSSSQASSSGDSGVVVEEEDKIIGYGEWYIYDRPRTDAECEVPGYIESFAWVDDEEARAECVAFGGAGRIARRNAVGTAPFGQVRFLCVDAEHRGLGAGSAVVRWGLDRCAELGVPAYLESSDQGTAMYERLGFRKLPKPDDGPMYAPMMWQPPAKK